MSELIAALKKFLYIRIVLGKITILIKWHEERRRLERRES